MQVSNFEMHLNFLPRCVLSLFCFYAASFECRCCAHLLIVDVRLQDTLLASDICVVFV